LFIKSLFDVNWFKESEIEIVFIKLNQTHKMIILLVFIVTSRSKEMQIKLMVGTYSYEQQKTKSSNNRRCKPNGWVLTQTSKPINKRK
jgi:hypothetical protein